MRWRRRYAFTVTAAPDRKDRYGDPATPTSSRVIEGCTDWPAQSGETVGAVVQSRTRRTLSLPAGAEPVPGDWLVIYPDGSKWRVVSEGYPWQGGPIVDIERVT